MALILLWVCLITLLCFLHISHLGYYTYETQIQLTNTKIKMSKRSRLTRAINYCGCGSFPPCKAKILASAISQLLEQDEIGLIYNVKQNIGRVVENRMMQEYQFKILIQYIN